MSTDRDVERIVRSWLDEGVTQLPDRVLDLVLDQLPATPQRRAWWPAWRFPLMTNNIARLGVAAVVIVLAVILGVNFLPGMNIGGPPDATPSAPASQAPARSLTYSTTVQHLEPGRYSIPPGRWSPTTLTFTVPAGWEVQYLSFFKHRDQPDELALAPWIVTHVYTDTCAAEGEFQLAPIGPSVDDLVNALEALGGVEVSPAVDVTIAGHAAKRVDLVFAEDINLADCRVPALQVWANAEETDFYARIPGAIDSVYVIDVAGQTLALTAGHMTSSSPSDVEELSQILFSIEMGVPAT